MQRYETIENDLKRANEKIDRLKDEKCNIYMNMVKLNDENLKLKDLNIKLLQESDHTKADLKKVISFLVINLFKLSLSNVK